MGLVRFPELGSGPGGVDMRSWKEGCQKGLMESRGQDCSRYLKGNNQVYHQVYKIKSLLLFFQSSVSL